MGGQIAAFYHIHPRFAVFDESCLEGFACGIFRSVECQVFSSLPRSRSIFTSTLLFAYRDAPSLGGGLFLQPVYPAMDFHLN